MQRGGYLVHGPPRGYPSSVGKLQRLMERGIGAGGGSAGSASTFSAAGGGASTVEQQTRFPIYIIDKILGWPAPINSAQPG